MLIAVNQTIHLGDAREKEGRAENRRVEIFISANEEMIKAAEEGTLK